MNKMIQIYKFIFYGDMDSTIAKMEAEYSKMVFLFEKERKSLTTKDRKHCLKLLSLLRGNIRVMKELS